jgi:predicted RNA-binding protein with PUA-like domain
MSDDAQHWLVKESPSSFSIEDFAEKGSTPWYGVRNYEARNNMQAMEEGDLVLYYHSSASPPGVVGLARVAEAAYPDPTQFDEDSPYYDEDATEDDPTWYRVDLAYEATFDRKVPLKEIKADDRLQDMTLVNRSRLSVQPVEADEYELVREMANAD